MGILTDWPGARVILKAIPPMVLEPTVLFRSPADTKAVSRVLTVEADS